MRNNINLLNISLNQGFHSVLGSSFSLFIFVFFIFICSCKKQESVEPPTKYDTLIVNQSGMEYSLSENTILTLDASINDTADYLWTPGNDTTPQIQVTHDGFYTVRITSGAQIFNYSVLIFYEGNDCYIPNSFSPNNDGVNDIWKPSFVNVNTSNYSLKIYNSDNLKLFETSDINEGWDGYYHSELMPSGSYYFVLKYQTIQGVDKNLSGMIELLQ